MHEAEGTRGLVSTIRAATIRTATIRASVMLVEAPAMLDKFCRFRSSSALKKALESRYLV